MRSPPGAMVLCDVGVLPRQARAGCAVLALLLMWLVAHELIRAATGIWLLPGTLFETPAGAIPFAAACSLCAGTLAAAWANRTRILWDGDGQHLHVEKYSLSRIARWRISPGEIAAMRVKRRPRRVREFWDIGFNDFAGNVTQIVRAYSERHALEIAARVAEVVNRPVTVKQ